MLGEHEQAQRRREPSNKNPSNLEEEKHYYNNLSLPTCLVDATLRPAVDGAAHIAPCLKKFDSVLRTFS